MNGGNRKGAAREHRPSECTCAGITLYPGNPTPDKASWFAVEGRQRAFKGHLPAMLRALITAGGHGVENRQCRLFSVNPGDQVCAIRKRGATIDMIRTRGRPNRWILRSHVREVLP